MLTTCTSAKFKHCKPVEEVLSETREGPGVKGYSHQEGCSVNHRVSFISGQNKNARLRKAIKLDANIQSLILGVDVFWG